MKKLPKAILFDADGTLYNSERIQFESTKRTALHMHDFDFTWELYKNHMLEGNLAGDEFLRAQGFETDKETYKIHKTTFYRALVEEELTLMPGALNFLKWCRRQSIRCVVVSASRLQLVELSLEAVNIRQFFDAVVAGDSFDRHTRKPHPTPYRLGLRAAGATADQVLAVEDTAKGIASAKAAGLRCIGIINETNNKTSLAQADHVISHYKELKAYLLK